MTNERSQFPTEITIGGEKELMTRKHHATVAVNGWYWLDIDEDLDKLR